METVPISTKVTLSLHPDNVKALDGYDDSTAPYVAPTFEAFRTAYEGVLSVWAAKEAAAKNPTWNEAQQLIHTDDFAAKQMTRMTTKFDAVRANLITSINALEQQLTRPLEQAGSTSIAAEIRAHVKGLSTEKRHKLLDDAVESGDVVTLTAVLAAPGYLSGISEETRQLRTQQYHEMKCPEAAKRLKVMKGALKMVEDRAARIFLELPKAVGAPPDKVNALRKAKSAAEAALILRDLS